MKQRYTITIAGTEMNVLTDESPEFVEEVVGILDRKMREINSSSRNCSKTEAAFLCALDYCSDKVKVTRKNRTYDADIALKNAQLNRLASENEKQKAEIERLSGEIGRLKNEINYLRGRR